MFLSRKLSVCPSALQFGQSGSAAGLAEIRPPLIDTIFCPDGMLYQRS
jgi:hypothetical protein